MPNTLTTIFTSTPSSLVVEAQHPNTLAWIPGTQLANGTWQVIHTGVTKTVTGAANQTVTGRLQSSTTTTASVLASGPVLNNVLATPSGISAIPASTTSINTTVSSIANQSGYRLFASDSTAGVYTQIYQGATASFLHTGLVSGQTKYYKWQYVGGVGTFYDDSPLSAVFSGATVQAQPAAPTNPQTDDVANVFRFTVAVISGNAIATTLVPVGSYVLILSEGDSMTAGGQLIGDGRMDQVQANLGTTDYRVQPNGRYYNTAVSGTGMNELMRGTSTVPPRITAMLARLTTAANDPLCAAMIVSLRIGINDLALLGRLAADIYVDYVSFANQVKAVSPKVKLLLGTLPNQQFASVYSTAATQVQIDTEAGKLNTAIRGGTVQDGIWDSQALAILQDPTNTAYFYDKIHLTHVGYGAESDLLTPLIRSLLNFAPRPVTTPVSTPLMPLNAFVTLIGNLASTISGGVGFSSGGAGAAFQSQHQYGPYPAGYDTTQPRVYVSALLTTNYQQIFGLRDAANTSIFYDGPGYAVFFLNNTMQLRGADWTGGTGPLNGTATVPAALGDVWAITVNGSSVFVTQNGVVQYSKPVVDPRTFRFHGNLDGGELADMREFATTIS